jgi:preprotein translocase subunit Sec61beta
MNPDNVLVIGAVVYAVVMFGLIQIFFPRVKPCK